MKRFKFLCLSAIFILCTSIFSGIVKADAILVTSKKEEGPGHNSVISQDEEGKWHYFFVGTSVAYEQEVPNESVKNIDTLNEWLLEQKIHKTKPQKSYNYYTRGTYIKGDFTETTKYYQKQISKHSKLRYYLCCNFCSVVSRKALEKGKLSDGKSFKTLLKESKRFYDHIPFYDWFPVNLHNLVDKGVKDTNYEGPNSWGDVHNEEILKKMKNSWGGSSS